MYIGIDLGTSGVKVVLLDENQQIMAQAHSPLMVSHPAPLFSEQNPADWWNATNNAMFDLGKQYSLKAVKAIGLTGQMHGATLLDKALNPLMPAILWNDGRAFLECIELEQAQPNVRQITGNQIMAGFTAPKILWLQKHHPEIFQRIYKVLLPKDYLRFLMTGELASDMSDASGTMWLDVAKRQWSEEMLQHSGLTKEAMPALFEGNQITGKLQPYLATRWGMRCVPVVAGGGDNSAGAIGVGLHRQGQGMLSLGTSGVYFVVTDHFTANPQKGVHHFCHALPERWHLMSVILNACNAVDWVQKATQINDIATLFQQIENLSTETLFLPYLSGERTPHNDPNAKGVFFGLSYQDNALTLAKATVEGVSFALKDGIEALHQTGENAQDIVLIGGGTKSPYWCQLLADITGQTLQYRKGGEIGPALGAAKLAQMALHPTESVETFCSPLPLETVYEPNPAHHLYYQEKFARYQMLYQRLKGLN